MADGRSPLRFGILGTARIADRALIQPARASAEVQVVAVASRDRKRAETWARRRGIERAYPTYAQLLADDELDAVYVPLPNHLHGEWTIRALEAGKHVLCEKPLALSTTEAERMAAAALRHGRLLGEAVHYRHHPLARRVHALATGGAIGSIRRIEAWNCFPVLSRHDIRYRREYGGGALMDLGCYSVNFARYLAGTEPTVRAATARLASTKVDRWMRAELDFPKDVQATITCSIWSLEVLRAVVRVEGTKGSLSVICPNTPHLFHRLAWEAGGKRHVEKLRGLPTTYHYQLAAFVKAARGEGTFETTAEDAVKNLRVLDAIYRRAGLPPFRSERDAVASGSATDQSAAK